jgi:hypothetical protein
MGVREQINQHHKAAVIVSVTLLFVCAVAIAYNIREMTPRRADVPEAYYTTDDGKTLFSAPSDRLPPFDEAGKQAVRALVFRCEHAEPFVGYLERYNPEALRILSEVEYAAKHAKPGDPPPKNLAAAPNAQRNGRQVKKPGEREWVDVSSPEGNRLTKVACPKGGADRPVPVLP